LPGPLEALGPDNRVPSVSRSRAEEELGRRFLAGGEVAGEKVVTYAFPESSRI